MTKQTVVGFLAGVFVMGVVASRSIYELGEKLRTIKKSSDYVIDFAHILLDVIEEQRPELILDKRISTFLDNQKFEEITHAMLPELEKLT